MTDPADIDLGAVRNWLDGSVGAGPNYVEKLLAAVEALRETNARLNRRCQTAEAGIAEKVVESGGARGRNLDRAAWALYEEDIEELRGRVEKLEHELAGVRQ